MKTMQLYEVEIVKKDGTKESVYIQNAGIKKSVHENLTLAYTIVATITFALTAYLTVLHLKQMHSK